MGARDSQGGIRLSWTYDAPLSSGARSWDSWDRTPGTEHYHFSNNNPLRGSRMAYLQQSNRPSQPGRVQFPDKALEHPRAKIPATQLLGFPMKLYWLFLIKAEPISRLQEIAEYAYAPRPESSRAAALSEWALFQQTTSDRSHHTERTD
jgi:hypothetical protein